MTRAIAMRMHNPHGSKVETLHACLLRGTLKHEVNLVAARESDPVSFFSLDLDGI